MKAIFGIFTVFLLSVTVTKLPAQTTWNGSVDNDWNTAGNWTGGLPKGSGAPPFTDPVIIAEDGANVTMSAAGSSRNLKVGGDGTETVAPTLNISQNLTNPFSRVVVGSTDGAGGTGGGNGVIIHTSGTFDIGGGSGTRRLEIGGSAGSGTGTYTFGGAMGSALY